jgi:hypothetical protein
MGKEGWFFRLVWKFDALILGVLGVVTLIFVSELLATEFLFRPHAFENPEAFLPAQKTKGATVTYSLGSHSVLDGTPYVLGTLMRSMTDTSNGPCFSSGRCGRDNDEQAVNYLLLDARTSTGHWLFPGVDHVVSHVELHATMPPSDNAHAKVTAVLVDAAPAKADENGKLVSSSPDTLYYVALDGSDMKKFFSAEAVDSEEQVDADTLLIFYRAQGERRVASWSIPGLRKLGDQPIPRVPR